MEKKPEIDGSYVEIEAVDMVARKSESEESKVLVVTNARLELAGEDKDLFVVKFNRLVDELSDETEGMDDKQKSFYILRRMLLS